MRRMSAAEIRDVVWQAQEAARQARLAASEPSEQYKSLEAASRRAIEASLIIIRRAASRWTAVGERSRND